MCDAKCDRRRSDSASATQTDPAQSRRWNHEDGAPRPVAYPIAAGLTATMNAGLKTRRPTLNPNVRDDGGAETRRETNPRVSARAHYHV